MASTQADDRIQIQKKESAEFEFPSAMNTVTEFYCNSPDTGVWVCSVKHVHLVTLTATQTTKHLNYKQK
jgi:hypothetical protein